MSWLCPYKTIYLTTDSFLFEKELKLISQCFQTFTFPGKIKRTQTQTTMAPSSLITLYQRTFEDPHRQICKDARQQQLTLERLLLTRSL